MDIKLKWFPDYEKREAFFQEHVSALIPAGYRGPGLFWREFTAITAKDVIAYNTRKTACITAFPQDGLAFASALQVLRAAAMGHPQALKQEAHAIELFKLEPLLNQALRTLSGGETVRLALAKAWLNTTDHNRLAIASPYSWLDHNNTALTQTVAEAYLNQGKPVTFLALDGENTDLEHNAPMPPPGDGAISPVSFSIEAKDLRLKLSQSLRLGAPPLWAQAGDLALELASPCLVLGENGAGKSLLVKALAKVTGYRGRLEVNSMDNRAPCRLLLQNTLSQSLFRTKDQFAPVSSGPLVAEYRQTRQALQTAINGHLAEVIPEGGVLDLKLALAAARLCQNPKLLILDEPEWGLSFTAATSLVYALCALAHARKVPIMIVSHKNWWRHIARSRLHVKKQTADAKRHIAFGMQIEMEAP